jgi:hypothetical protein
MANQQELTKPLNSNKTQYTKGFQAGREYQAQRIIEIIKMNSYRGDWDSPCAKWVIELIEQSQDD